MSKNNTIDMREGSLLKKIIIFLVPVMLSGILQNLFNVADMIVVGKFSGSDSLAAVGATGSLCNSLINFFIGLSIGCGVVASLFFGADDHKNLSKVVNTAFYSSLAIGIVLIAVGYIFSPPLLRLMNTPENIIDRSVLYMRIYFIGMPANMVFNFMNAVSRSVGDTTKPMIYLTCGGIINVVLNIVFVVIFHMGVSGVAFATIISQYISAYLITRQFLKAEYPLKLNLRKITIEPVILKKMISVGLPAGIQSTAISISNVLIQSAINSFGSSAVAGFTAGSNIGGFVYIALNSVYHTNMTLTAQNYGCGNIKRIRKGLFLSICTVVCIGMFVSLIAYLLKAPLVHLYTDDPVSVQVAYKFFFIVILPYTCCGIMEVLTGCMRGLGHSLESMIISLCTMAGFRILWNYSVFLLFPTIEIVFIAYPISWILANLILSFRLKNVLKKEERIS